MKSLFSELPVFISLACHYSSAKETERFNRTAEKKKIKKEIISTENRKTMYCHLLRHDKFFRILKLNCDHLLGCKLKKIMQVPLK